MLDEYKKCIEACYLCATACDNCAASCLDEENLEMMRECIKLDMQCANICRLAAQFMTLNSGSAQDLCRLCADVCQKCVTSVESMNMTIVRIAQALVITAPNNAERWPPEKNSNYQTRFGGVLYSR